MFSRIWNTSPSPSTSYDVELAGVQDAVFSRSRQVKAGQDSLNFSFRPGWPPRSTLNEAAELRRFPLCFYYLRVTIAIVC